MRKTACFLFFCLIASLLPASDEADLLFRWDLRLWGGDLALGWKAFRLLPGVDTILWASAGGGYQAMRYGATAEDAVDPAAWDETQFTSINGDWRLGLAQGILYNQEQKRNLIELLLLYRGKYQYYIDEAGVLAGLPEAEGLFQNALFTGLLFDDTREDKKSLNKRGIYSVLSAEFVPAWFGNEIRGLSDFTRLSYICVGYLPVLESRAVSIYLGDRVLFDWLFGEEDRIPVSARTSFGALTKVPIGSNPLHGLGGTLRGIPNDMFDGFIKLANNFDLRLHSPALTLFNLATPMAVAYFDAGVGDHLSRRLAFEPVYCAAGLGVGLYALGFDLILYGTYFINERWLYYGLGLGAHF